MALLNVAVIKRVLIGTTVAPGKGATLVTVGLTPKATSPAPRIGACPPPPHAEASTLNDIAMAHGQARAKPINFFIWQPFGVTDALAATPEMSTTSAAGWSVHFRTDGVCALPNKTNRKTGMRCLISNMKSI